MAQSADVKHLIHVAKHLAVQFGATALEPHHVSVAFTRASTPLQEPLATLGWNYQIAWADIVARSGEPKMFGVDTRAVDRMPTSQSVAQILNRADREAGGTTTEAHHVLETMLSDGRTASLFPIPVQMEHGMWDLYVDAGDSLGM